MDTARDEEKEALLRCIIAQGSDAISLYLNDEEAGCGDLMPVQEGEREDDSGDDPTPVQEGDRDDGSGDRTESGQVYILVKPVLTS